MSSNDLIHRLERLELGFQAFGLSVDIEWLRAIRHTDVPNHEWHSHANVEIHFLLEGNLHYTFPNSFVELSPGKALLIPANMPHKLCNEDGNPYFSFTFNFSTDADKSQAEALFLSEAMRSVSAPKVISLYDRTVTALRQCLEEAQWRCNGYLIAIKSCLLMILVDIAREVRGMDTLSYPAPEKQNIISMRAERIAEYIKHREGQPVSIRDIARHMYLSERQVQRITHEAYGVSVGRLIQTIRIKQAKEHLKNGDVSVSKVAERLGFSSPQSFCRFFAREEGVSPTQWRESILPQTSTMPERKEEKNQ